MLPGKPWRLISPESSVNYTLNPSGEIAGNFAAAAAGVVNRVTTYQHYGLYSYSVVTGANGDGISLTTAALANTAHYVTLRVTGTLPPAWRVGIGAASKAARKIEQIDPDWTLYGVSFSAAEASAAVAVTVTQSGAGAGDFYLDGIQVEALGHWTTYVDGTQQGCAWNGADHAATSTRSGQSLAGGELHDLWDTYSFFTEKMIGVGAAPLSLDVRNYAILPGGELAGRKIEPRQFTLIGRFIAHSEPELHEKRQALVEALSSDSYVGRQPVRLNFSGARVQKQIDAYYEGGLEAELPVTYGTLQTDDQEWRTMYYWTEKVSVQFLAPDPMWYEVGESAASLSAGAGATFRYMAGRRWELGQWDDLGLTANPTGGTGTIFVMTWGPDNKLYVGGNFIGLDGVVGRDYIAAYDPTTDTWETIGGNSAINGQVEALVFDAAGDLIVGGSFTDAGTVLAADFITRWDGAAWNAVGIPDQFPAVIVGVGTIHIDVDTGDYFIGGNFTNWASIANADHIVRWDISAGAYAALGTGADGSVSTITQRDSGGDIYIGGGFANLAGTAADGLMIWDGTTATKLGDLTGGTQRCNYMIFDAAGNLYCCGNFTGIDGESFGYIAQHNGSAWTALGTGLNNIGYSMAIGPDRILWVGGAHSEAGGVTLVDRISQWNGSVWDQVDVNLPGVATVYAVEIGSLDPVSSKNYDLYVGFDTTGAASYADTATVTNDGSYPAFPKIVIDRAAGGTYAQLSVIRNEQTGKQLLSEYPFQVGERLTIDLTPTQKSVISSIHGPRLDALKPESDMGSFSLIPNDNTIAFFAVTDGTVTAYMQWRDTFASLD